GYDGTNNLPSGGRYDPSTDTWAATSLTAAPFGRSGATAVWTGSRMIVWGGYTTTASTGAVFGTRSGGRYDPAADTWAPITLTGAPSTRYNQSGVWTGNSMVIWGGLGGSPVVGINSGAFYDPGGDVWSGTPATSGVPSPRYASRAVWTGNSMLVWGGQRNGWYLTTGGLLCVCPGPVGTWYQDADGDGHGDATVAQASCARPAGFVAAADDCNEGDAQVWSVPPEVTGFDVVSSEPLSFAWNNLGPVSGPGTVHGVVSGGLLPAYGMDFGNSACLASGPETSYTDLRPDPSPGTGFWYLVRGSNSCGTGTYGSATFDASVGACP